MSIFRTGNELIINLCVPQYYFCPTKVVKTHKGSVKNDPGSLFVEKPNFPMFLPPDFGVKCTFLEPEMSQ